MGRSIILYFSALMMLGLNACKQPAEDLLNSSSGLFSIDGSGLQRITGIQTTRQAGDYAIQHRFIPSQPTSGFALNNLERATTAEINQRCGLRIGMTVVMALSYLDGHTTGQLGGRAVLCRDMPGEVYRSIAWEDGEICFSPQNLTTTQLVRAPGHTDGPSSLLSLTEFCRDYTEFFLAMNPPQSGFGLAASTRTEVPQADQLYRGALVAERGSVNIALAGSKLNFNSSETFVLTHREKTGGPAFGLQGSSGTTDDAAVVRAYHEGNQGFRGFTFSERGKGEEMMTGESTSYDNWQTPIASSYTPQFSGPSAVYGLYNAPTPYDLGMQRPQEQDSEFFDKDLKGGEFQIFWK